MTDETQTKNRTFGHPVESPSEFLGERIGSTLVDMVVDEYGGLSPNQLVFEHDEHGEWATYLNEHGKIELRDRVD